VHVQHAKENPRAGYGWLEGYGWCGILSISCKGNTLEILCSKNNLCETTVPELIENSRQFRLADLETDRSALGFELHRPRIVGVVCVSRSGGCFVEFDIQQVFVFAGVKRDCTSVRWVHHGGS
jgi:hypothetical protein